MAEMPSDMHDNAAFIFFDLEESGLFGSKGYYSKHRRAMKDKLIVNFDCVSDGENILFAVNNSTVKFTSEATGRISVFSFDDTVYGVYERGLLYTLENASLNSSVSLGVSNEFTGEESKISVENGTLLIYTSRKNYDCYLTRE
jgi:hypothetical protein